MAIQVIINGLVTGLLFSLVALGFSLIYSGTRVFHIAHGAIYTAGPYFFLAWTGVTALVLGAADELSLAVAITLSLISICLLAISLETLVYRPLSQRNAPPLVSFISSLGLYIVVVNLIALLFGNETKILNPQIEPSIEIAGAIVTRIQIIQFAVSAFLILITLFVLRSSSLGRNIRALSDNPTLLSVLGTNIKSVRLLVFVIGSLLAASSSLLRAFDVGVDPHVGLSAVLTAAVAVIIAGIGSHGGAIVGALLIGLTQNIVVWFTSAQWQDAVTFFILTIVLLVRREGLFATQLRLEER
jgi:branched-chain amino acid transport system permease protein